MKCYRSMIDPISTAHQKEKTLILTDSIFIHTKLSSRNQKFIYDASGHLLLILRQNNVFGKWMNVWMYTYTYDPENNLTSEVKQIWAYDEWINNTKTVYELNQGRVSAFAFDWDGSTRNESTNNVPFMIYMNGEYLFSEMAIHIDLFYTDVTSIEEQDIIKENENIHCYPNPATDQINIEINPA